MGCRAGIDVTFNYGIFNFTDDFSLRFTQGKTDYIVLPIATSDYMSEYQSRGVIRELVLNTDSAQRAHLWQLLIEQRTAREPHVPIHASATTAVRARWISTSRP